MILCSCHVLSDRDIRARLREMGNRPKPQALFRAMACDPKCGRCLRSIAHLIDQTAEPAPSDEEPRETRLRLVRSRA